AEEAVAEVVAEVDLPTGGLDRLDHVAAGLVEAGAVGGVDGDGAPAGEVVEDRLLALREVRCRLAGGVDGQGLGGIVDGDEAAHAEVEDGGSEGRPAGLLPAHA